MSSFRVRLRLPSSKQETLSLPNPVTIRALLEGIQPFVDVDITQIKLRLTYPPKALDLGSPSEWDRNVKSIGINNGEGLVVRIGSEPPSASEPTITPIASTTLEPTLATTSEAVPVQRKVFPSSNNPFVNANVERPITAVKPSPSTKANRAKSVQDEPPEIPVEGGTIVLRIMEDDNSCMYIHQRTLLMVGLTR